MILRVLMFNTTFNNISVMLRPLLLILLKFDNFTFVCKTRLIIKRPQWCWLAYLSPAWEIVGSIFGQVIKPKTINLVIAASLLNTTNYRIIGFKVEIICGSGTTCLLTCGLSFQRDSTIKILTERVGTK